ncbi:sensor histidine kinase [Calidifontibacter terrae]
MNHPASETLPGMVRSRIARFGRQDDRGRAFNWGRAMGYFWSCIWLLWLVQPLVTAIRAEAWSGIFALVAFVAAYVWQFTQRGWVFSPEQTPCVPRRHRSGWFSVARYALMVALAGLCMVTIGQDGAATMVFTAIAAVWSFPMLVAVPVAAATAATYVGLWSHVDGWRADWGSLIGLGFGVIAVIAGRTSAQRQRALDVSETQNAQLAVEAERNRLARDVHDILGHSLTVITVKAELAGKLLDTGQQDRARTEVADLERLSREALTDVRRAVEGFREISLPGELARAREALSAKGIHAYVPTATDEVAGDARELFAWVVREGITNVIRHSNAVECRIELAPDYVVIADDGTTTSTDSPGNGLRGLRERARSVGYRIVVTTGPGFRLEAVPADREG